MAKSKTLPQMYAGTALDVVSAHISAFTQLRSIAENFVQMADTGIPAADLQRVTVEQFKVALDRLADLEGSE